MTTLELLDLPTSGLGRVLPWLPLAGAVAAFLLYRRETRSIARPWSWLLPLLRSVVVALVLLMLLAPVLRHRETIGELGRLLILIDRSESMDQTDPSTTPERKSAVAEALDWPPSPARFDRSTRWDRLAALLSGDDGLLATLAARHDVTLQAIGDGKPAPLSLNRLRSGDTDERPLAWATDLGSALRLPSGRPPQAVVLLTDGNHNAGPSPTQAAELLGQRSIPVHAVAIGPETDAADLVVLALDTPESLAPTQQLTGSVRLRDTMPAGVPLRLVIDQTMPDGPTLTIWDESLVTTGQGVRVVDFDMPAASLRTQSTAGDAVAVDLVARLEPVVGELTDVNNSRATRLQLRRGTQSVLLLDGRPRWEARYLRNALDRDPQWELTEAIAAPGEPLDRSQLPRDRDGWFDLDVVVLGELPPDALAASDIDHLREFVERRGGGLVTIDGSRGTLARFAETPLGEALPQVRIGPLSTVCESLLLTAAGRESAALRLLPDSQANTALWPTLPPPRSAVRTDPQPGATVLLEASVAGSADRVPLLTRRPFGAGQVVSLATDETWRWRYKTADRWHSRFWNQLLDSVRPPTFAVRNDLVALDAGRPRYQPGQSAPIRVQLTRPDGRPATDAIVEAVVQAEGQPPVRVALQSDPAVPGLYRGTTPPLQPGETTVSVRASGFSEAATDLRTGFLVAAAESAEQGTTTANPALLRELAALSGGTFRREENAGELVDLLQPLSRGRVVETETRLRESPWLFGLIVGLLAAEWWFRKRAGLV